jgi:glucan-binding YG repeat protein
MGLIIVTSFSVNAATLPEKNFTGWFSNRDTNSIEYYENGNKVINKWIDSGKTKYYIKDDGTLATGWLKINYNWYYFTENGFMKTGWLKDTDGKYYYLQTDGVMLKNTITSDGYKLDSNGVWIN